MTADWAIEHHRGSAAVFHARSIPEVVIPALWWFEVERPAVVLGSTQRAEVVDRARAEVAGIEVAHRRSGGGAVFLDPGAAVWIDVLLPASDPRWDRDVGRSFAWLGRAWVEVVGRLGVTGATAHDGAMVRTAWSDLVCFAGLGPGEVTVGGRKVVGISQRRTRAGARFQCALLQRWDPGPMLDVLALDPHQRRQAARELADVAIGTGPLDPRRVVDLLQAAIASE